MKKPSAAYLATASMRTIFARASTLTTPSTGSRSGTARSSRTRGSVWSTRSRKHDVLNQSNCVTGSSGLRRRLGDGGLLRRHSPTAGEQRDALPGGLLGELLERPSVHLRRVYESVHGVERL